MGPQYVWSDMPSVLPVNSLSASTFGQKKIFSDNDEHRQTPLSRFCDSGAVYNSHDLLTYFLTYLLTCDTSNLK